MKKRISSLLILIGTVLVSLTSCKVNWFDRQYDAPWWMIAIPVIIFSAIMFSISGYIISSKKYVCPKCGMTFHPKWRQTILSIHIGSDRLFKCPHCNEKSFCRVSRRN